MSTTTGEAPIDADDRLLAQVMLALEQLDPDKTSDSAADRAARVADGDAEHMLVARARSLRCSRSLQDAIRHVRQAMGLLIAACVILALAGGAGAARAALGTPRHEPVNFFHVLAVLLGVQIVLLLIWLYVMLFARRNAALTMAAGSLGGLIMALAKRLVQLTRHGSEHTAAVTAVSAVTMRGSLGKWTFSAISNGLWLAFNVGCLAMVIALLSTRQYTFAWETTILSSSAYVRLTNAMAVLPRLAGFDAPNDQLIRNSQWKGVPFVQTPGASQAWSSLLFGSLIVYGFGPRLLLLALCLGQRRSARAKFRLDVDQPEAVRILERLAPISSNLGVVDGDDGGPSVHLREAGSRSPDARPPGPPAILALEIERPQTPWPPSVPEAPWHDLGFVDDRNDRHRVLNQLRGSSTQPRALVIVCGLPNTPDRGAEGFLRELASAAGAAPVMLLTGGHQLRQRSDADRLAQRVADWRTTARHAGIADDRVIELDLDHLAYDTIAALGAIMSQPSTPQAVHQRRIEPAFDLIADFARRLEHESRAPADEERLKLHREIAALYRPQHDSWQTLLRIPRSIGSNLAQQIKGHASGDFISAIQSSASRFTQLMPERLKRSPRWLASGAAAGALGCVAAAALISPVAIGSLPIWSAIGAAIAAAVQPAPKSSRESQPEPMPAQFDDCVRAAALFALVLELQGHDEAVITRMLDAAIPPDDRAAIDSAATTRIWLDDIRHRLDIALTRESAQ